MLEDLVQIDEGVGTRVFSFPSRALSCGLPAACTFHFLEAASVCFPQCERCAFRKLRSPLALSPISSTLQSLCACANCSSIMRRRWRRGPGRGHDLLHHALDGRAGARFKLGSTVACRQANVLLALRRCWRPILQPTWLTR